MRTVDKVLTGLALASLTGLAVAAATNSTRLWLALTSLGSESAYLILSIAIMVFVDTDAGIASALAVLASGATVVWLKNLFALPRPPRSLWRAPARGYGFPSGHTQVASSFWTILTVRLRRASLAFLSASVILCIAASRVALNVHYPRDVIGGAAIGFGLGLALWAVLLGPGRRLTVGSGLGRAPLALYVVSIATFAAGVAEGYAYSFSTSYKIGGLALSILIYPSLAWMIRVVNGAPLSVRAEVFIVTSAVTLALTGAADYVAKTVGAWTYVPMYFIVGLALFSVAAAAPVAILRRLEGSVGRAGLQGGGRA